MIEKNKNRNIEINTNSYYAKGGGKSVSAKYNISESFIVSYNNKTAGTLTWDDLITIQADYDADTKQITVKIIENNENYKDVTYSDKRISVDPTRPTVTRID